jgi:predicted permease
MKLLLRMNAGLRNLFHKERVENELNDELDAYVAMRTDEQTAAGMPASEARRTAMIEFGGVEQVKQSVRDGRAGVGLELLWQDARFATRQFKRNPGFTATVIVTLALSIGANTAIFSLVNALILDSLPYAHPERIGTIYTRITGPISEDERHHVNGEQFELLRDNVPALLSAVSATRTAGLNFQAGAQVKYLHAGRISQHYFDVLAIHPMIGRNFSDTEDRPHGPRAAILSYELWQNTFGANANIVGQPVLLKSEPYTVVGVLPQGAFTPLNADLYTALQPTRDGEGGGTNFDLITRLRDGANWQEADAEINRAWLSRPNRYELEGNPGAAVAYYSVPLQKGQTATLRPQLLALMLAAGFILLIACANLAALTLVRMLRRTPEIATRLALGASRWQIQKQLWIENLMLAFAGGAAGIAVGFAALHALLLLLPEHFLPVAAVHLDGRVLGFTLLVSLLTSVLFGMLPALATRKFNLRTAIGNRAATGSERLGLRQALIVSEIALTLVLLAASGLLIRTLIHLQTLPPGFNPAGVMTARASLDDERYHDPIAFRKLLDESTTAMRRIPGVQMAAVGLSLPYERALTLGGLGIDDGKEAGQKITAEEVYVTPGYFETLQIPVVLGRPFSDADRPDTQPVMIVNRTFVRKFFHGGNPIGRHLGKNIMIVGMVEDVAMAPGIDPVAPLTGEETMYIPAAQVPAPLIAGAHVFFQPSWIVRTGGPVQNLTAQMQSALTGVDANLPFSGFYSMRDLLVKTLNLQRVEVALLSALAALALLLSTVGIVGLVANIVAQKTREIGIRIALGSSIQRAMVHTGAPAVKASILGLILGLILSGGVLRAMHSVLYGIGVYDAPTIVAVIATLTVVTLSATILPTMRIAGIDPAKTLRDE